MNFVFTCGDINGIGPEIVIKAINKIQKKFNVQIVFVCPKKVFLSNINFIKPELDFHFLDSYSFNSSSSNKNKVLIYDFGNPEILIGKPTKSSGKISFQSIQIAFDLIKNHFADAMITAPISKTAFKIANISYNGHTELLADWTKSKNYAMMFLSKKMFSALATIHIPVKKISNILTKKLLSEKFKVILDSLRKDFKIENPKIAVLGLNPHAGENGILGQEEVETINPVIKKFNQNIFGCFSADAFFANKLYKNYNCVIGMYHDQILIPFKMMNFKDGVNYTAGLPIIRTSPDHGTAFEIAGKNLADESSIYHAFIYAKKIYLNKINRLNEK